jgi:hypothetical protein
MLERSLRKISTKPRSQRNAPLMQAGCQSFLSKKQTDPLPCIPKVRLNRVGLARESGNAAFGDEPKAAFSHK